MPGPQLGLQGSDDERIERLLELEVADAEPLEDECRRYYERNPGRSSCGELLEARQVLREIIARLTY